MTLAIRMLGGLDITLDGRPIRPPLKNQALLAYLACQTGDQLRETVAELLWPNQPPKNARHSLRNCLLEMRKALGGMVSVEGNRHYCRLAIGVTSDVATLKTLAETKNGTNPAILDLYRGRLLDGFDIRSENFSDWLNDERRRIDAVALLILSRLATHASIAGAHEIAISAARMAVQIDELDETSHQQLIVVLLAAGRRVEAIRFLHWARELLHRELGEAPSKRTLDLLPNIGPKPEMARSPAMPRESEIIRLLEETLLVKTRDEFVALRSRIRQALADRKPAEAA